MMEDYYKINKEAWNARTKIHLYSSFYDLDKFKREVQSVPDLDLSLLGDVRGKSILHLQCHFGMDTLSLSKMLLFIHISINLKFVIRIIVYNTEIIDF